MTPERVDVTWHDRAMCAGMATLVLALLGWCALSVVTAGRFPR